MNAREELESGKKSSAHPFRAAVLRGLAVVLPPLLTIVILLWVFGTVKQYLVDPVLSGARAGLVWAVADIRNEKDFPQSDWGKPAARTDDGLVFQRLKGGAYIPLAVYERVERDSRAGEIRTSPRQIYARYVELEYLKPYLFVPFFVCLFVFVLYLLGRFMAAGIGRIFWGLVEGGIHRVPLVRTIYSSVKQVSDFLLSSREELEYSRVVAVEWPRKGMWALAFVTGEGIKDVEAAANEQLISVLLPNSPIPATGFTLMVQKNEALDLNITLDQAIQFVMSCGVVLPPQQLQEFRKPLKAPPPLAEGNGSDEAAQPEQQVLGP